MVDVLSDSFEQPLSSKKTPNSDVAINEPTSAAFFCLSLDFFGLGCCVFGVLGVVFPVGEVAGFLSGFPDNPSCVKCAILASCAGFPPVSNRRSKMAAVAKWTDSERVRGRVVQVRVWRVEDYVADGTRLRQRVQANFRRPAAPHVPQLVVAEQGQNSVPGKGSLLRIHRPHGSGDAWPLLGLERLDTAFSIPTKLDSHCFGRRLRIVFPGVSWISVSKHFPIRLGSV